MNPASESDYPPRTVRDVRVFVRQLIWPGGASSYDVHLAGGQVTGADGYPTDCLTMDESFDDMPGDADIERLPYIAPSIRRETQGVYVILTGPYRKGPYPSRAAAQADITAGNW